MVALEARLRRYIAFMHHQMSLCYETSMYSLLNKRGALILFISTVYLPEVRAWFSYFLPGFALEFLDLIAAANLNVNLAEKLKRKLHI